jgi:hypothetical protein
MNRFIPLSVPSLKGNEKECLKCYEGTKLASNRLFISSNYYVGYHGKSYFMEDGEQVPKRFQYYSETNGEWLSLGDLVEIVKDSEYVALL